MQWNQMTKAQQDAARKISGRLAAAGVADATASQIAKHFDQSMEWERGTLTLAELCDTTGWTAPAVEDPTPEPAEETRRHADDLGDAIAAKVSADEALKAAIVAEHARGTSANQIARRLDGVMSRPVVLDMLGAASLRQRLLSALREAGFGDDAVAVDEWPGRRVTVQLAPPFGPDLSLPDRWNAAAGVLDAARTAGLQLTQADGDSTLNMQEYIGEGSVADVHVA